MLFIEFQSFIKMSEWKIIFKSILNLVLIGIKNILWEFEKDLALCFTNLLFYDSLTQQILKE